MEPLEAADAPTHNSITKAWRLQGFCFRVMRRPLVAAAVAGGGGRRRCLQHGHEQALQAGGRRLEVRHHPGDHGRAQHCRLHRPGHRRQVMNETPYLLLEQMKGVKCCLVGCMGGVVDSVPFLMLLLLLPGTGWRRSRGRRTSLRRPGRRSTRSSSATRRTSTRRRRSSSGRSARRRRRSWTCTA